MYAFLLSPLLAAYPPLIKYTQNIWRRGNIKSSSSLPFCKAIYNYSFLSSNLEDLKRLKEMERRSKY